MTSFVLVGGGVASAATAAGLRSQGYDGRIVLVSDELHLPYERPPLSKEFLAGTFDSGGIQANPEGWYADNDVEVLLGTRADAIDPARRRVTLSDGGVLAYDALVLATGVRARTLPGFSGDRVHSLRSIADSERLAARLTPGSHLVILGGGFIGCEVAAIAATQGVRVTVFERGAAPLARVLGPDIGDAMMAIHGEHGVEIRTGQSVTEMKETASRIELSTRDGEVVECDEVLVGIGSVANAELAAAAGIAVDGGIVTDEFGRTSAPDVYAIGDVASRHHPTYGRTLRVEHHDTAMRHGGNAARNILGEAVPFTEDHYFWSDQYSHSIKSIGHGGVEATKVLRGSVADRSFSVFSHAGGRITSVVTLDRPQDLMTTRKLLATPHEVTTDQLADPDFDLKSLLPQRQRTRRAEASR